MRLFVYKSYFLERHIINEIQTKELNFNMKLDGNYYLYKDILYTAYHEQGVLTKKGVKVDSLVSLKDRNVKTKPVSSTFLATVVGFQGISGKKKNVLVIRVQESGETAHKVGDEIEIKNFYSDINKFRSVVQVLFPPYQATPVGDEIRDLSFAARNEVVSIPAFSKVPCILGGTHNGTTTPLETDYIDVVVVENGKDFKDFQAINDLKDIYEEEGFDTTTCHTRFGEAITANSIFKTSAGVTGFKVLMKVMYGNKLEQSDIPTIGVGCAMLRICEFWGATALKYRVAMCLMKYYPIAEYFATLYVASSMHKSPELQYACLLYLSSVTEIEMVELRRQVEWTREPAPDAHGNVHIVNCISTEDTAKMYNGVIDSLLSPIIGQYEASVLGAINEAVLRDVSKSQGETMKKVYQYLGKTISVGEKRKFEALKYNADEVREFVQTKTGEMQLLIGIFRKHTEALTNGYKSDSETLRKRCLGNATTKKTFRSNFIVLIKETEEYFGLTSCLP